MSKEVSTASQPSKKKGPTMVPRSVGCLVITVILGFFGSVVLGATVFFDVPFQLVVGWIPFLIKNIKTLETNWEMTACGIGALLIAVFGLHRFLLWIRKDKPWKWAWTISVTALILMLFAASIAMTGIIHQLGWMAREPLTENSNRSAITHNVSNAKQLFLLLIEYGTDHENLPDNLEVLVSENHLKAEELEVFRFYPGRRGATEPWIYLGADKSLHYDESDENVDYKYPLLISPRPIHGKWIVLRMDGAVKMFLDRGIRKEYPWLLERLPNLMEAK